MLKLNLNHCHLQLGPLNSNILSVVWTQGLLRRKQCCEVVRAALGWRLSTVTSSHCPPPPPQCFLAVLPHSWQVEACDEELFRDPGLCSSMSTTSDHQHWWSQAQIERRASLHQIAQITSNVWNLISPRFWLPDQTPPLKRTAYDVPGKARKSDAKHPQLGRWLQLCDVVVLEICFGLQTAL